ncbi:MAG: hypothetical protein IJT73_03650 [Selenomonadaceae bacterium]|nr:hypothetical protein [Selenomonadaceae bacterium]
MINPDVEGAIEDLFYANEDVEALTDTLSRLIQENACPEIVAYALIQQIISRSEDAGGCLADAQRHGFKGNKIDAINYYLMKNCKGE